MLCPQGHCRQAQETCVDEKLLSPRKQQEKDGRQTASSTQSFALSVTGRAAWCIGVRSIVTPPRQIRWLLWSRKVLRSMPTGSRCSSCFWIGSLALLTVSAPPAKNLNPCMPLAFCQRFVEEAWGCWRNGWSHTCWLRIMVIGIL